MKSKHDDYIKELLYQIRSRYDFIATSVVYHSPSNHTAGEIDLLAIEGHNIHIYEVKCNDHYADACLQLNRAKNALQNGHNKVKLYYYIGIEDKLTEVD